MTRVTDAAPRKRNATHLPGMLAAVTSAVQDGSVLDRRVEQASEAIAPRNSKGYGPHQRKWRPPLSSGHHFNTMGALRERQACLDAFRLTPELAAVQRMWGALYTQALYTDHAKAKQVRTLLAQVEEMRAVLGAAAKALHASLKKGAQS